MTHQLGMGVINLPFGLRMANQPPERLYTYFRNQIAMLRLPHIPAAWKLRFVASLPARSFIYVISNRFARPVVKAIGLGIADGLMNRLGAPGRWRAIAGQDASPRGGSGGMTASSRRQGVREQCRPSPRS